MAVQQSTMTELGAPATFFDLPVANPWVDDRTGDTRSLSQYGDARALVIVFTCNHCPYAKHIQEALVSVALTYQAKGVQFIAISANDPEQYPSDGFEEMARRARQMDFPFPYLFDETQEVAKAYGAVCTPDIFVYNADLTLAYRGRFDETRPGQGTAHGGELAAALDSILETGEAPAEQYPSMGCNIKWKPGNAP